MPLYCFIVDYGGEIVDCVALTTDLLDEFRFVAKSSTFLKIKNEK